MVENIDKPGLYPLTKDRAKPAVPFGGAYRLIDFVLSNLVN
ncbi:sugar phosphate nucleotidyltransferase, partial [Gordonia aichiensis]